ncbi:hypothetical protein LKL35_31280 [Streptomyces sp. ET3-23]|uniref:hypothetical protein n=1 Tax=Streptomyces sp. ET3-23 TaxID=2885643 RepID=UPI001D11E370|nr:hypothetical protein [Streptomyces sp. ET3-23]MCC2279877.1 hypothetical protein [Streptomyces sp. ET3-23]
MTETDIPAVSAVRVSGWKSAYAGMIPQSYLDGMTVEGDIALRRRQFARFRGRMSNLVATDGRGDIVGFLQENVKARRFYERAGYASDGAVQSDDYDGVPVAEVRYRRALDRVTQCPSVPRRPPPSCSPW